MSDYNKYEQFNSIIEEMSIVYKHDLRPWLIGFSGGKDSTLLCHLVFEMLRRLDKNERNKTVYIVSSDTMVENPIVCNYMHRMSEMIGKEGKELNIKSDIVYPKTANSFWCKVIGLGYPTPEPPGFRWCTDRLKIQPMNEYVDKTIKNNGEVVILLGVRKAESSYRARNITNKEIEGKILVPHQEIENAYVYNPLTEIPNDIVWGFLLSGDAKSPWNSDNKYLFSLYQGENLGEEQSVVGEIDKEKIPVTGNSRFGCWICTMVKEDKSLKAFIDKGAKELIPLREYRNWLVEKRNDPNCREKKRRNGSVYVNSSGELGLGPFTMETRAEMLKKLLLLEQETGMSLITKEELREIDKMWDEDGDISRRKLVDIYYEAKKEHLPWDAYKTPIYGDETLETIQEYCKKYDVEYELIKKLLIDVEENKKYSRETKLSKSFDSIMNQGWIHFDRIREETKDGNKED